MKDQTSRQLSNTRYKIQLCMTKHGNPLYQMQHGFKITEGNIIAKNGPDVSEEAIRVAWFALEHASSLLILSTLSFIVDYVPDALKEALVEECNAAASRRKELEATTTERWGTEESLSREVEDLGCRKELMVPSTGPKSGSHCSPPR